MTETQKRERKGNLKDKVKKVKKLLDERSKTKLHDFIVKEIHQYLKLTNEVNLRIQSLRQMSSEEILEKISKYEDIASDLATITTCIAYWAKTEDRCVVQRQLLFPIGNNYFSRSDGSLEPFVVLTMPPFVCW